MVKEARLIVLAEVAEGGEFEATVRAVKTFKGDAPAGPFRVHGFNDRYLPKEDIAKGAFRVGQRYYLFLGQSGDAYHTPTPSAGVLLLDGGKVRLSLHFTTWSRYRGTERPAAEVDDLLASAAKFQAGGPADRGGLDRLGRGLDEALRAGGKEAAPDHFLLALHLAGEDRYLAPFHELAGHESMRVRIALARLLGQVKDERAPKTLEKLLLDADTFVQGEAVRRYARGEANVVGPVLVRALRQARPGGKGPAGLMDPVRNTVAGGKLEIVRALGRLKYQPAAKDLLELFDGADDVLFFAAVEALREMGNADYVAEFEKRLEKGDWLVAEAIADLVKKEKLTAARPGLERFVAGHLDQAAKVNSVIEALGAVGDEGSARLLEGQLKALLKRGPTDSDPTHEWERLLTTLIGALGDLKYTPAKPTVYEAVFRLYGFDDTMTAAPRLMAVKEKLEKQLADRAVAALPGLKDKSVRCLVFLENRRELANNPAVEPRYTAIVRIDTADSSARNDLLTPRKAVAAALKLPLECVGISCQVAPNGYSVEGVDPRLSVEGKRSVLWKVCHFLRAGHDRKDAEFLRWAVENGYEEKGLVDEILPGALEER
jgi:HEAT repeat protein